MKKCKITVLKTTLNKELAEEYCISEPRTCPCFREGDVFTAGFDQPENFCGWAWNDIYRFITVFLSGGNFSTAAFEGWMKNDKVMVACCSDAVRPVVFKIELIETEN